MERWCWVNFQCRGVLLIWIKVGQVPTALAVGAGGVVWTFFSLIYLFSFLSASFWETARYTLTYCLEGPLSQKQPTNYYYFTLQLGTFVILFLFHIEIEGKGGWIIGEGGGGKGYVGPTSQIIPSPPLPTPMCAVAFQNDTPYMYKTGFLTM